MTCLCLDENLKKKHLCAIIKLKPETPTYDRAQKSESVSLYSLLSSRASKDCPNAGIFLFYVSVLNFTLDNSMTDHGNNYFIDILWDYLAIPKSSISHSHKTEYLILKNN